MYALKNLSAKTPAGRAARGAQACRGLDNAAFDRLPLSGCSAGFYGQTFILAL